MNRSLQKTLSLAAAAAMTLCAGQGTFAQVTLEEYKAQVDAALPIFDGQILLAPDGAAWFDGIEVSGVAQAVGDDEPPGQIDQGETLTVARDLARTKVVKIDTNRSRIRYINQSRLFDFATSDHTAVDEATAEMLVQQVESALGIPAPELGSLLVNKIVGVSFNEATSAESLHERERLVTRFRIVNGFTVFESRLRAAIANDATVARLLVEWPQFQLQPDLELRDRDAVVEDIAQRILEAERILDTEEGENVGLNIALGYARAGDAYLPVARAAFVTEPDPPTDADGDEIAVTGRIEMVPLALPPGAGPDRDMDGVPDTSDNCPEYPNPGQEDSDGDNVGDPCDSCPEVPNPGQEDADANGVGDACEPATEQDPPGPPAGLLAEPREEAQAIALDWGDNLEEDLDGYNVYRSEVSGDPGEHVARVDASEYVDADVVIDTTYYYTTTATDTSGNESGPSEEAEATLSGLPSGWMLPGDCNADAGVNIADAICLLGFLFVGIPRELPCGEGTKEDPANTTLLDWNDDGGLDVSDAVGLLQRLFLGGPPHPLGVDCQPIADCPEICDPLP